MTKMIKISIYINESDQWHHRPLHLEVLNLLHDKGMAGGTVLRGIAGFTKKGDIESISLVDIGSKLPLVIQFIDTADKVNEILPEIRKMVANRLIVREEVESVP